MYLQVLLLTNNYVYEEDRKVVIPIHGTLMVQANYESVVVGDDENARASKQPNHPQCKSPRNMFLNAYELQTLADICDLCIGGTVCDQSSLQGSKDEHVATCVSFFRQVGKM